MNDEDIFIKKYGVFTKEPQMLYCDFCSIIGLIYGQNVYFVGFGVIMFKDKPYWNPLLGLLKNKLTNSPLKHNPTFAILSLAIKKSTKTKNKKYRCSILACEIGT